MWSTVSNKDKGSNQNRNEYSHESADIMLLEFLSNVFSLECFLSKPNWNLKKNSDYSE